MKLERPEIWSPRSGMAYVPVELMGRPGGALRQERVVGLAPRGESGHELGEVQLIGLQRCHAWRRWRWSLGRGGFAVMGTSWL